MLAARRRFFGLMAGLIVATSAVVFVPRAGPATRPNVLVILTDDQRPWGALGTEDSVASKIRDQGVRFTHAFATTPLCCPSRSSLLTGLYAHNHRVIDNRRPLDRLERVDSMTIADALHDAGYATGMFGKYLNGWPNDVRPSGFDRFAITPDMTYDPALWNVNGRVREVDAYATTFIRRRSLSFLDWAAGTGKPWFAYITPMAPHLPATPSVRYGDLPVGRFPLDPAIAERDRSDKPPYVQAQKPRRLSHWRVIRRRQLRTLASVDDLVEAVLARIRSMNQLSNTIIVYSSDNGFTWGEHGLDVGGKSVPYLPSVRVPLFIRWSGHIARRTVDPRLVALLDLAPTILHATGTPLPHTMDGIDLLRTRTARTALLLEFWTWKPFRVPTWAALVSPTYEYVRYYDERGRVTFREYYDLTTDRYQLTNLLHDGDPGNDPHLRRLSLRLRALRTCAGRGCVV
jgi:arylsulfatase A-like enzyme